MEPTTDEFEPDWVHSVFRAFRDEVISIAADFSTRVKHEIDQVAAAQGTYPPSAATLLASVAIETTNMTAGLFDGSKQDSEDDNG